MIDELPSPSRAPTMNKSVIHACMSRNDADFARGAQCRRRLFQVSDLNIGPNRMAPRRDLPELARDLRKHFHTSCTLQMQNELRYRCIRNGFVLGFGSDFKKAGVGVNHTVSSILSRQREARGA